MVFATRPGLGLAPVLIATLWLSGCGQQVFRNPVGPYNRPSPSPQVIVATRGCGNGETPAPDALTFPRTQMIRQGTDLDRVADDLSGAVPGGNLAADSDRALVDAQQVEQAVQASNLCPAVRGPLVSRLDALTVADQALVNAAPGDAGAALDRSRAAAASVQDFLK
ncbi:MAG: hypothetical protein ACYDGR_13320 [Candidatus Dormibacteria bacterium]